MQCPHCDTSVGFFSPPMRRWGREKKCPGCGNSVLVGFSLPAIALGLLGAGILGWFKPHLGLSKIQFALVQGVYVMGLMWIAARLRKYE